MSLPIEIRRAAEADLLEAFSWYESELPGLGIKFLDAAERCMLAAAARPSSFKVVKRRTRVTEVRKFPYRIYFVAEDDRILILACLHASRSTRYIRQRLA
jgi:toxin ParE1/3/4